MNIETTTQPDRIHALCAEGEANRLRYPDGGMREIFKVPESARAAAIARTDSGKPVAIAVVTWYKNPEWGNTFNVYVRGKHRRRGIGRALYRRLESRLGHGFSVARWNDTSHAFYESLGK